MLEGAGTPYPRTPGELSQVERTVHHAAMAHRSIARPGRVLVTACSVAAICAVDLSCRGETPDASAAENPPPSVTTVETRSVDSLIVDGRSALYHRQFSEALSTLREAELQAQRIVERERRADVLSSIRCWMGDAYLLTGDLPESRRAYASSLEDAREWLSSSPKNAGRRRWLAIVYGRNGRFAEQIAIEQELRRSESDSSDSYGFDLVEAYVFARRWGDAIEAGKHFVTDPAGEPRPRFFVALYLAVAEAFLHQPARMKKLLTTARNALDELASARIPLLCNLPMLDEPFSREGRGMAICTRELLRTLSDACVSRASSDELRASMDTFEACVARTRD